MIRFALVPLAVLLAATAAQAASFDCARATTPFETAICTHPELSAADEVLAQAYATALGGLSQPAARIVTDGQKAWLDYAARACSDDAEPIATPYTDDQAQCLAGTFRERIQGLEASRMLGGYRFYPLDSFSVRRDTEAEPDAYNKVTTRTFQTIRIDAATPLAAAFNAAIDALRTAGPTAPIAPDDVSTDTSSETRVTEVTSRRISLETNDYWYGHGAAHGNYTIDAHHFLIDEQRLLDASDIFAGEGWQQKLAELALAALKEKLGDGLFETALSDLAEWVADPRRWTFTEDGLVLRFQIYEVTAYAYGAPQVTIGWPALDGLLAPEAEAIASPY